MKMKIFFAWYDLWIGAYYDQKKSILYICPFPMYVISIQFNYKDDKNESYSLQSIENYLQWNFNMESYYLLSKEDKDARIHNVARFILEK